MNIRKETEGGARAALTAEDLALIAAQARRPLEAEEVYAFSVRLCDNEVDRDGERFPERTLEELAELFVGKSGIFDHQWSARGQAARIYKTEVVRQPERRTRAGDAYCWLKGYAYMMRTEGSRDLIAEIEGGIKREVSVGCAVKRAVCSICGADRRQGGCGHEKGEEYGGRLCFVSLEEAEDAFEFSFVAVPAQREAGVVKGAAALRKLAEGDGACHAAWKELEQQAALGREWLGRLRQEVVRLGLLAGAAPERAMLTAMVEKLSREELEALEKAYGKKAAERYPLRTQWRYETEKKGEGEDGAFLI